MDEFIVIGAGILGAATAWHLARLGAHRVRIIDRFCPGAGATGRAGALVRADYDNETEARLALHSLAVYRRFADEVGGDAGFAPYGLLVAISKEETAAARALAARQWRWGVDIHPLDPAAAHALAPGLRTEDVGLFLHQADAGACDPGSALAGYVRAAEALGVVLEIPCRARRIVVSGGRARAIETDRGLRPAGAVVLAAGAWAAELLPPGINFGLTPRLSRVAVFRPTERNAATPGPTLVDRVQGGWFRPMPGGAILVGCEAGGETGVSPEDAPETVTDSVVRLYRKTLVRRFAVSPYAPLRGAWGGVFMLSPDHRPLVGAVPGVDNLWFAGGDSGGAFKIAPALGLGLAETIVHGRARTVDISALAPARVLDPGLARLVAHACNDLAIGLGPMSIFAPRDFLELMQVDVFSDVPLAGNAAAVVLGADALSDAALRAIARETNLSETVFLLAPERGGDYRARIFTRRREIPFAGHPSLAAAHAFAEASGRTDPVLHQECGIGLVAVARGESVSEWYVGMPPARFSPASLNVKEAAVCFGLAPEAFVARAHETVATGVPWLMIELGDTAALARITPDHSRIAAASRTAGAVGVTLYARDPARGIHARLRSFAPAEGIYEDPVCGSCAGSLAARFLRDTPDLAAEPVLIFEQGIEIGRPGRIVVRPSGLDKLAVGGACITVLYGRLNIGGSTWHA